ncbi:MAG: hypothetical protein BJ554DRAFT_3412 [Olpidium bornovanus]|uniref:Brl1/Brr6 domain-containing protein n=1 Tax=Olpidium bornovanus TaxID=278681 RepID=A0A8H8A0M5_9FUNG|nr:MAG: hypothetical protein BJ554DRAFT_3412 [Olpidium bornovanus]
MEFEYDSASGRTSIFAPSGTRSSPQSDVDPEQAADASEQATVVAGSETGVQGAGMIAAGLKRSHSTVNAAPETDGTTMAFGGPFMFSRPSTAASNIAAPSANFLADGVGSLRFRASNPSPSEPPAGHSLKKARRKRARSETKCWRAGDSDEDDDGNGSERDWKAATFDHHSLPYVISGYLQLTFNIFVVAVLGYLVMVFIRTVQRDVDLKVEEYSAGAIRLLTLVPYLCSGFCVALRASFPLSTADLGTLFVASWAIC